MGRYDKIKVYSGGTWKTPTYCRVYNNGVWADLGADTSANTKSLYVRKGSSWVRATLNRQTQTVITDRWLAGSFNLLPANGYNFCPSYSSGWNWYFRATIRKTTSDSQRVFWFGTGSNYVSIYWNANGTITATVSYSGTGARSVTSSNAVGANQDVYLNVYANKGSTVLYINFNGVTTSGNVYNNILYNNASNAVGDTYMQFRGNISVGGVDGSGGTHSVSFDAGYASGSDGWQYQNANHRETSTTQTIWV